MSCPNLQRRRRIIKRLLKKLRTIKKFGNKLLHNNITYLSYNVVMKMY